jgi:diguanylate cyclase (GGDEF)-like protein
MRILIAEDHPQLGQLLCQQLHPWGYETIHVYDGRGALDVLRGPDAPRLALLDWLMPGLDGIELCRRLRAEAGASYPYLILMTGQGGRQQMLEGLEAGADEFLSKPVEPAELKARLGAARRIVAMQEQLRDQASRDALTGVWNRAAALSFLERELERARRQGQTLAVALADLDHFKRVNDTLGHFAGDAVLREAARRMLNSLRPYDAVGRYGGEEFLIVLPDCDADAALGLAERLRQCVTQERIEVEEREIQITLSLGVAALTGQVELDAVELLRAADSALYEAKRMGRNRVVFGTPTPRSMVDFPRLVPMSVWGKVESRLAHSS